MQGKIYSTVNIVAIKDFNTPGKKVPWNCVCYRLNILPTTLFLLTLSRLPGKKDLIRVCRLPVWRWCRRRGRGTTTHSLTLLGLVLQDSFSPLLCAGEYRGKGWSDEPPLTGTMKHDSTISDTQLGVAGDRSRSFQGNKNWRNYLLLNPKQNKAKLLG